MARTVTTAFLIGAPSRFVVVVSHRYTAGGSPSRSACFIAGLDVRQCRAGAQKLCRLDSGRAGDSDSYSAVNPSTAPRSPQLEHAPAPFMRPGNAGSRRTAFCTSSTDALSIL